MPIIKTDGRLIYYAHVPKCGGSSVAHYLKSRFGNVAFSNTMFTQTASDKKWSKTSPQHIDAASLSSMFPDGFFDAVFTIVRHPVARVISAYHFQQEVEQTVPKSTSFSEWLHDLQDQIENDPFAYDNHMRPMADIVPTGAKVFFMEHGLDALIPWLDDVTSTTNGPRSLAEVNKRGAIAKSGGAKVEPNALDLDLIERIYGKDFRRFGYTADSRMPLAEQPVIGLASAAKGRRSGLGFGSSLFSIRRRG